MTAFAELPDCLLSKIQNVAVKSKESINSEKKFEFYTFSVQGNKLIQCSSYCA